MSPSTPPLSAFAVYARVEFASTRWSQVIRAQGPSEAARLALGDLCAVYYAPVEAFVRRKVSEPERVRDLVQEFFARLLAGNGVDRAKAEQGRFRSYLLGAVKHFLLAEQARAGAAKRGAAIPHLAWTNGAEEPGDSTVEGLIAEAAVADPAAVTPEVLFDRGWACAVLERALARLEAEYAAVGRSRWFDLLKPALQLGEESGGGSSRSMAAALGMSETALKVAIHRLRKHFRAAVKQEVADTLADPAQVEAEMRELVRALRGTP